MQPPQGFYRQNPDTNPQTPQWTQVPPPGGYDDPGQPAAPYTAQGTQLPPPAQIVTPYPPAPMPGPVRPETGAPTPWQPGTGGQTVRVTESSVPQGGYQVPPTGMTKPAKRVNKALLIVVIVLTAVLAAVVALRFFTPGKAAYGYVQIGPLSSRYTGEGLVVRDETVYTQEGVSQIEYEAAEGARVARGTEVAKVYSSGFSAKEWTTLRNYRSQIKEYHKTLIAGASNDSKLLNYMSVIQERALEAQQTVQGAGGNLIAQEDDLRQAMQNMQLYLRQKYPDDQKLTRLYDDENNQMQRISSWVKQYAATTDGMISFYTDGFENALNMSRYQDYSPTQVRQMIKGVVPAVEGVSVSRNTVSVYRVVRENPWAVLMLCNELDWTPVTGRMYQLRIENFDNTVVWAEVESFTRSGGEMLVRLRVTDPTALQSVLYIRSCRMQLGESVESLMVPSRAVYLREGRKGVVIDTEGGEYWMGVEVINDDGQDAYIIPDNPGVLYEGLRVRLF